MSSESSPIPNPEQANVEMLEEFSHLIDTLLEESTQHTEVWKSATYEIQKENQEEFYESLMQSKIAELIQKHQEAGRIRHPDSIFFCVEDFDCDNSDFPYSRQLEMILRYDSKDEFEDIRVSINPRTASCGSYLFLSEKAETGYEGQQFISHKLNVEQLSDFYRLVKDNSIISSQED